MTKSLSTSKKRSSPEKAASFNNMRLTENSPFSVQEAYNSLRTNISFSLMDKKIIGITSPQQHDGKSTVAINLGASFAQIGKKVLVIDCDLHLPTIASKLRFSSEPGFSNFMIRDAAFSDCTRRVDWTTALFMPAGTLPPDPSRILDSPSVDLLFEKLRQKFDLILLDLPPVNTVSDAVVLAGHGVDGYIVVVRHGCTDTRDIHDLMKKMQMVNGELLGFVYNDSPLKPRGSYYNYGYGYGYGRSKT